MRLAMRLRAHAALGALMGLGASCMAGQALADYPLRVGRSGLTLVLVSTPGTAAAIAQAIDESGFDEQVGTLAGDNTLLVLFADEASLERWHARLAAFIAQAADGVSVADLASTYP